jgi:hypothetical protein
MAIKVANNQSLTAITALPSAVSGGAMTLLETQTASSSDTLDFTDNIDSTYDEYVFRFINMQSASTDVAFQVNFRDGSTAYDATKTTTFFYAQHSEDDGTATLSYLTSRDEAQSSDAQHLTTNVGRTGSDSASGYLQLFNPSSTTFVKHFMARLSNHDTNGSEVDTFVTGYCNVTAAIDAVQFTMSSGDITAGTIKLYGVS